MVTLNTLNTLIDDILLIIRNSNIVESENINRLQIRQWIDTYRALLLKQDIDKDGDINPEYIQTVGPIELDVVEFKPKVNFCKLKANKALPKTLDLNKRYGILSINDRYGNLIQFGDQTKAIKQKYRRFTCNDYIAYMINRNLELVGPNLIKDIYVSGVFENPDEVSESNGDCINDNTPYPLPYDKIPALKDLILSRELGIMTSRFTDTINNRTNDDLNVAQGRPQNTVRSN